MAKYSNTNTILLWTRSTYLEKSIPLIAGTYKPKIKIHRVTKTQDLITVPGFLIIIDADFLTDDVIKKSNAIVKHMVKNNCSMQIFGTTKKNIPKELKELVSEQHYHYDKRFLKKLINFHYCRANG
jgi:hypothetical protein